MYKNLRYEMKGFKMKKLFLVLVLLLSGCVVSTETEESWVYIPEYGIEIHTSLVELEEDFTFYHREAEDYCSLINARLPYRNELEYFLGTHRENKNSEITREWISKTVLEAPYQHLSFNFYDPALDYSRETYTVIYYYNLSFYENVGFRCVRDIL